MILKMRYSRVKCLDVIVEPRGDQIYFEFPYNEELKNEIKALSGARWDPRGKQWYAADNLRNRFVISFLARAPKGREGQPGFTPNPYTHYDTDPVPFQPTRSLMSHQVRMAVHGLTTKRCVWAADMGTGKTLAAIEVMEYIKKYHGYPDSDFYYVAPKSALVAVQYEFIKWESLVTPKFMTYESLRKVINEWPVGKRAPKVVVFDECSRLKNPTAQRTQAASELVLGMIKDHLDDKGVDYNDFFTMINSWHLLDDGPYIIEMSGTPAPKAPTDWWSVSEIACAGFLKERDVFAAKMRLAVLSEQASPQTGGKYQKLIAWRDGANICNTCGYEPEHDNHDPMNQTQEYYHEFAPAPNEVENLYRRLGGLVIVVNKADCMDLPEKVYHKITLQPKYDVINAAKMLRAQCTTTIDLLTRLRALSDGFQYKETFLRTEGCTVCNGLPYRESIKAADGGEDLLTDICPACSGTNQRPIFERTTVQVPCPKEDALIDLLDQHEEYSRIVIYAGFTGSVDRCVAVCRKAGWATLKVDGHGVKIAKADGTMITTDNYQGLFLNLKEFPGNLAFVGQPGAGGMGLTLVTSPSIVFWSNDFNGESRMQAEDRIHRPGCRGANIYDLVHLPEDEIVIENLKRKRNLQDMTLGRLRNMLELGREVDDVELVV